MPSCLPTYKIFRDGVEIATGQDINRLIERLLTDMDKYCPGTSECELDITDIEFDSTDFTISVDTTAPYLWRLTNVAPNTYELIELVAGEFVLPGMDINPTVGISLFGTLANVEPSYSAAICSQQIIPVDIVMSDVDADPIEFELPDYGCAGVLTYDIIHNPDDVASITDSTITIDGGADVLVIVLIRCDGIIVGFQAYQLTFVP